MEDKIFLNKLINIVPSSRQLAWQKLEFTGFLHFGINTFIETEWGHGDEDISIFNPLNLDANQWIKSIKNGGINAVILTCKHHDGFCLWPSKYTKYTVANTPYKDGKGDIVKEVADACKLHNIKFGVYLSPWDRNAKCYGTPEYNDFYINQLEELLTNYGDIYCVWWDGACGEGENGKKQEYDLEKYMQIVRKLQPNACTSVCGSDIRWCGNEAGVCRESEWSVVSNRVTEIDSIKEKSQQQDDEEFRTRKISSEDEDLGSRDTLRDEKNLIWYPAEVDTSIRAGWFYHENDKVKSLNHLLKIYYNSVGGNSVLLLNIPPNKEGLIADTDTKRLKEIGDYIKNIFKNNVAKNAIVTSNNYKEDTPPQSILLDDDTYFKTQDYTESANIQIKLDKIYNIKHIVLQEQIKLSQRVEEFEITAIVDNKLVSISYGTTIGYKKICQIDNVKTDTININIKKSRISPTLKFVGIYN